jgi:hypothetical protein
VLLAMVAAASAMTAGTMTVGVPAAGASAVTVGSPPDLVELNAVACPRLGDCLAVGQDVTSGHSFAKAWNGTRWRVLPAVAAPASPAALWDVACPPEAPPADAPPASGPSASAPPTDACIAVGSYSDVSGFGFTLAVSWDGARWRLLHPASPGLFDGLSGIACPSTRRCVAVGATLASSFKTLAETWDGTRWRVLATPTPGGWGALNAVACPLPARCVAVGSTGYGGVRRPLALAWDGTRWRVLASPPSPDGFGNLLNISCDGPRMCVATGYAGITGAAGPPLIEVWNGAVWHSESLPMQ